VMVGQKNQPKTNQKTNQPRQKPTFSWLVADPSYDKRGSVRVR
jgi:hypothetical protein